MLIETSATVKHLNARKEGPSDDKVLALDIKLTEAEVGAEVVAHLLGVDDTNDAKLALWEVAGDQNCRFLALDKIGSTADLEHLDVTLQGVRLTDCRAKKFQIQPIAGRRALLAFQVSVADPPADAMPILAEYLGETISVALEHTQAELFAEVDRD